MKLYYHFYGWKTLTVRLKTHEGVFSSVVPLSSSILQSILLYIPTTNDKIFHIIPFWGVSFTRISILYFLPILDLTVFPCVSLKFHTCFRISPLTHSTLMSWSGSLGLLGMTKYRCLPSSFLKRYSFGFKVLWKCVHRPKSEGRMSQWPYT